MNKYQLETDLLWWGELRASNKDALVQLYLSYYPQLISFGRKFTDDTDIIKDGINSVFLYFWEKRLTLNQEPNVRNYIFTSFRRAVVRVIQKNGLNDDFDQYDESLENFDSAEIIYIKKQQDEIRKEKLKQAIMNLPKRERQLIILKYYHELSYEDIALKTGLSIRTVYNRVNSAIKSLRSNDTISKYTDLIIILLSF